jgi:Na+-driven multidrug efflux pump
MDNTRSHSFLATEKPLKLMGAYSVPCIISLLVAALYNIVDQIFIANADYLGSHGNAANTAVFPLTVFALAIAVMIGDGACAFASIALGSGRNMDAHRGVGSAILLCLVSSLFVTGVYLAFAEPILRLFGGAVNDETFECARQYFFWITLGMPFFMFGQAMNPVIRSDGSPKFAMFSTVLGAVCNIILDPVFIFPLKMGMAGAAIATVIGQMLTALLAFWYLFHMKAIHLKRTSFRLYPEIAAVYLRLGLASFLSQASLVVSMAAVQNMCTKYSASDPVYGLREFTHIPLAVLGIVMKFFQISISVAVGMAAGCIPVVGYNIGAGLKGRAKQMFMYLLAGEAILGIVSLLVVELFPDRLIQIFGASNESPLYRDFAVRAFRLYLCLMPLAVINKGTFIYLQALGKALESTILSLLREIILGMFLPLLLPLAFALDGVIYSFPAADLLTFGVALYIIVRTCRQLGEDGSVPALDAHAEGAA